MKNLASASFQTEFIKDPEPGKDGKNGVTIIVSPEAIVHKEGTPGIYDVCAEIYEGGEQQYQDSYGALTNDVSGGTLAPGITWAFRPIDGKACYRIRCLATASLASTLTVPFTVTYNGVTYNRSFSITTVADGGKGDKGNAGHNGVYIPPMMLWEDYPDGYEFKCGNLDDGETRLDVVLVKNPNNTLTPYRCTVSHTKASHPTAANAPWEPTEITDYKSIATDLLLAKNARIEFLSGEAILVGSGTTPCGYFGAPSGGVILFLGASTPEAAPFRVSSDGRVVATRMEISGNSTFRGFVFKEKTVITADNYSMLTTVKDIGYGDTMTVLDLLKTGNWIEVKYTPPGDEYITAYLPVIRVGVAYSDTYRDYVRQFLGNEVIVYNSSTKMICIDSGESTIIIMPECAVHFRMVFAPEKMGSSDTLLERIKWEYSEPFQF